MCFDVDSAGDRADAENLNQLVAIREARGTELLKTDLFKILGLCELLRIARFTGLYSTRLIFLKPNLGRRRCRGI